MAAWMLAAGMAGLLLSGCEDQNKQAEPVETAPPQAAALTPYPGDAGAAHADEPTTAAPPAESAEMAAPEPMADPEPVDTAVKPAPRNNRPTARQAPKESYPRASKTAGRTYTVKKGDTLQEISQKFYGTTTQWRRIYTANRKTIGGDANKLKIGTKLSIP
jgi:nucleoid-associated protein YgaU